MLNSFTDLKRLFLERLLISKELFISSDEDDDSLDPLPKNLSSVSDYLILIAKSFYDFLTKNNLK